MKHKLNKGDSLPYFTVKDHEGFDVSSDDLKGKVVALFFYPKDETPESIRYANLFQDSLDMLEEAQVDLIGISPDTSDCHSYFRSKNRLTFTLFSDEDLNMCHVFDVLKEQNTEFGKKFVVEPSFFLINNEGKVIFEERGFELQGLLERSLKALQKQTSSFLK